MAGSASDGLRRSTRRRSKHTKSYSYDVEKDVAPATSSKAERANGKAAGGGRAGSEKEAETSLAGPNDQEVDEPLQSNKEDQQAKASTEDDAAALTEEGESEDESEDGEAKLDAFEPGARETVDAFEVAVAEPAVFLRPNAEISELARKTAKTLFNLVAAEREGGKEAAAAAELPEELYVDGFDAEQIWLQLEAHCGAALKRARRLLRKAGEEPSLMLPEMEEALDELLDGGGGESEESEGDEEEEYEDMPGNDDDAAPIRSGAAEGRAAGLQGKDEGDDDEEGGEEDDNEDHGELAREGSRAMGKNLRPAEDRFMRLDDMERFVEAAERAAAREDESEDADAGDTDDEEFGARPSGRDPEANSEDDELAAVLDNARKMSGSRADKRQRFTGDEDKDDADDADEDDDGGDGDAETARYEDFFDPVNDREAWDGQHAQGFDAEEAALDGEGDNEDEEGEEEMEDEEEDLDDGQLGCKAADGKLSEPMSAHERRMKRMAERAKVLEQRNIGDKEWFMQGETHAGARPLNSALEIDLDFERAVRPPPQPTEEATASLEDLIRSRIAERDFDDVPRVAPPAPEVRRKTVDLDDKQSSKGLGEIYEEEYVKAAAGGAAADDKDEKIRNEARALVKLLFAKLDALSHFHYAPKPVIEDLSVRADVPALAMEEVAPQIVSEAAMRLPEEVYRAEAKGQPKGEDELTREERRRRRAQKKRAHVGREQQQAAEKATRPVTQGGTAAHPGRRSAADEDAAAAAAKAAKKKRRRSAAAGDTGAPNGGDRAAAKKAKFGSSGAFFGQLQDQREAAAAGVKPAKKPAKPSETSKAFKL